MKIQRVTSAPQAPGIYAGLSNADYHAGPGISKSQLDTLARSPLHFWAKHIAKQQGTRVETAAMRFGTAVHTAILEPEDFVNWVVMDKVDRRTKDGKAAAEAAETRAAARGVRVIDRADHDVVTAIAASVERHPVIGPYLEAGWAELSVYWMDEDTGVLCRCRPDWLTETAILDVKTTENSSPGSFERSAYQYRYWVQAAYYLDGLAANGCDVSRFVFAAVEKEPPFAAMAYTATPSLIDAGRREYKRLLNLYSACCASGRWPAYGDSADLDLPRFAPERMAVDNADAFADESL